MRITNRLGLPQPIVDAVINDGYTKGDADASVTELVGPPRIAVLKRLHAQEIEEDASDRIWSLMGQAVHTILERANQTGVAERRLSVVVEGWKISGGMDLVHSGGTLSDYKVASVWSVKEGIKSDWIAQLNVYRWILSEHGEKVENLEAVVILRDWRKREATKDPYYPQAQVVRIPIPVWPLERAQAYVRERVILHQQARLSLPLCTPEERWAKPEVWAVMKKGRKSALRLHESEGEALAHKGFDPDLSVVHRPGESTRCLHYCPVSKFCSQAQSARPTEEPSIQSASGE